VSSPVSNPSSKISPPPGNKKLGRRAFLISVLLGLVPFFAPRDLWHDLNQTNLNKVLESLSSKFKNDLLSNPNDLPKNLSSLLDFLTNEKIKPPNEFLINAKNRIKAQKYNFQDLSGFNDFFVDFEQKIIYLNGKNLLSNDFSSDKKLQNVLMALFSICGLINLPKHYQSNKTIDIIANEVLCQLISKSVIDGMKLYNFDEIQCSSDNELQNHPKSKLSKIINYLPIESRNDIRAMVIDRMKYLKINNRSNGTLNTY